MKPASVHRIRFGLPAALATLLVATSLTAAAPADATDPARPAAAAKRPKICLVLSGGGARGAAHVGVIKVLEELRVPVDCIAGTSMGSIVGGAYATGMSVPDMEKMIAGMSVEKLFKELPPRKELSFRRKADDYVNYIGPEIGTSEGKTTVGKGVISGVQLETVLREIARFPGYHRFDTFPIPFRAVATDLVTGKAVVFDEGELANVMRASMSVPGAVAPAEYRGMILVDGMLTSNLPVEVGRAMGADVIIAVNVGTPLLKREELTSIFGVASQMLSILTEQNVQASLAKLKPTDVLITPDLGDFSTADFDNLTKIAPKGEEAARKLADQLSQFALPPAEYAALRKRQQVAVALDTRPVDEIRFENLQTVNPEAAQAVMETRVGEPLDTARLDADMRRIYGTGDFEHVNYRVLDEAGRRVLSIEAAEKAWGPNYLRLGISLYSDFGGETYFSLLAGHRMTWLNSLGAELRTDATLGFNSGVRVEFYQPLTVRNTTFVAPRASWDLNRVDIFQGKDRVAVFNIEKQAVALDFGLNMQQYGEARIGVERGRLIPRRDTGPALIDPADVTFDRGAYRAQLLLDRLDNVDFPRQGWAAGAEIYSSSTSLGADASYNKWIALGNTTHSFGENSFRLRAAAGGSFGSDPLPEYEKFPWGGFLRQSGYNTGQLLNGEFAFGQVIAYRRIMRGSILDGAYGGLSLEGGRYRKPLVPGNPSGELLSAALFVSADSPVGPVYLGYGWAEDGNKTLYFFLGRPF
ncbi:MAG: patatin-like phospholipase family protein [Burkholderiaceae bacterium]|jgi:NTE family protein|nr:patatin-like phospholipase family protein [Burkholderiaceae bacterium]